LDSAATSDDDLTLGGHGGNRLGVFDRRRLDNARRALAAVDDCTGITRQIRLTGAPSSGRCTATVFSRVGWQGEG
jgi:hypothetical protein